MKKNSGEKGGPCACSYIGSGEGINAMARAWRVGLEQAIESVTTKVVTVPFSTAFGRLHMRFAIRDRVLPVFEVKHQSFEAFDNILI